MTTTGTTPPLEGGVLEAAQRAILREAARRAREFANSADDLAQVEPWDDVDDGRTNGVFFAAEDLRAALAALDVIGWPGDAVRSRT